MAKAMQTNLGNGNKAWLEDGACVVELKDGTLVRFTLEKLKLFIVHLETMEASKQEAVDG
jgi:hypothetical protein